MDLKKRWFHKRDIQNRNVAEALKTAYSIPKRAQNINFSTLTWHGLFAGLLYAVLMIVVCLSIGEEELPIIIGRGTISGIGLGLLMAAITELWDMGFMIERILTIVLGCGLVVFVC